MASIDLQQLFLNLAKMRPTIGLFFHDPDGYPSEEPGLWQRREWMNESEAWERLLAVAATVPYGNFDALERLGRRRDLAVAYGEIQPNKRNVAWSQRMAIVISMSPDEITAIFRDPAGGEQGNEYCVIALRLP